MAQTHDFVTLSSQLVVAERLAERSGYSWTLASRLGDMLAMAEDQFGCRDPSYTVLGIEFIAGLPKIWFPGGRKHIVIQIGLECASNVAMACWQLAHECVHLLSPTMSAFTTVLEEGLCVVFQERYVAAKFGIAIATQTPAYREAAALVSELLTFKDGLVADLRREHFQISSISSQLIQEHCPGVRRELADKLAAPFQREQQA